MAAFTALAIGAALGAGFLFGKKKKGKADQSQTQPAQTVAAPTPAEEVQKTNPVSAPAAESANTAAAKTVAARTRRRAAAGNAGKVAGAPGQSSGARSYNGVPRSLLGS